SPSLTSPTTCCTRQAQCSRYKLSRQTLDDLLNNLIGRWSLTGKMGDTALYQEVNAKWVLRELFVEMRFSSVRVAEGGNPDYEALYLIGHDEKTTEYVLHLFDTFGVTSKPVPGIGTRKDNTVRDRKSTRLNSSHVSISYAVFCLKKINQ